MTNHVTKADIRRAEIAYCEAIRIYGPDNMTTIREEVRLRELRDAYTAQRKPRRKGSR